MQLIHDLVKYYADRHFKLGDFHEAHFACEQGLKQLMQSTKAYKMTVKISDQLGKLCGLSDEIAGKMRAVKSWDN